MGTSNETGTETEAPDQCDFCDKPAIGGCDNCDRQGCEDHFRIGELAGMEATSCRGCDMEHNPYAYT